MTLLCALKYYIPLPTAKSPCKGFNYNQNRKPVVFDPVGVGATGYRRASAATLLNAWQATVIKGNSGELAALANSNEVGVWIRIGSCGASLINDLCRAGSGQRCGQRRARLRRPRHICAQPREERAYVCFAHDHVSQTPLIESAMQVPSSC